MVDYDYRVKSVSLWCAMGICLACNDLNQSTSLSFCTVCGAKLLLQERYAAAKVLGQGAFGKTFLATDNGKPSRPNCVIKQFVYDDPNSKAKALMLFDEEAVRLDDLGQHPQIPALLAHCQHEGRSYLVQEFIDGDNLQIELDRRGALSEWEVRDVLLQLLPVLDYIHRQQVIHRDIKPENIMRRRSGEQLVLVDFGAAKYASATALAKTGTTIGSPSYAAPEQARGKAVFASDLYGLGVTCLHLLTGVDPFTMFDDLSLGFAWRDFLSGKLVSGELGNILDKLTQHRPMDRYGTAMEVLNAMGATAPKSTITKPVFSGKTATDFFNDGKGKSSNSDFKGAIADYNEAIRLKPDYVRAYSGRGLALKSLGQEEKAKDDFQKAISLVCNTADDYHGRGNAKAELGDKYGAIADYNEAIRINPNFVDAYLGRGYEKSALGDKQGAIADYTESIRINPNYADAYRNRGYEKSNNGDKYGAIADYNEAIRINPNYADAYYNRAYEKSALGDKQGAIADYTESIRINPNYADAYRNRGYEKSNNGDKYGAIADYNEAIRINPNFADAYVNRAYEKSNLGDKQGAITDYNEAIRLNPNYTLAYNNRGLVKYELGNKQGAITDYNEAIRINQNWGNIGLHTAYNNRGLAKYYLGDEQGAIADYSSAISLNPNCVDLYYYNRGIGKFDLGDKQGAIADYNEAIRTNPNYAAAYYNRANTYQNLGEKQKALADFREASRLHRQQGKISDYEDAENRIRELGG